MFVSFNNLESCVCLHVKRSDGIPCSGICLRCTGSTYSIDARSTICHTCITGLECSQGRARVTNDYWHWIEPVQPVTFEGNLTEPVMEIHVITCPKGHCQAIDVINTTNDASQRRPCVDHRSQSLQPENVMCALCEPNWAEGGPDNTCVGMLLDYSLSHLHSEMILVGTECPSTEWGHLFGVWLLTIMAVFILHVLAQTASSLPTGTFTRS
jgi:hypothetical protein